MQALAHDVVDPTVRDRAIGHLRAAGVRLPKLGELAAPHRLPGALLESLPATDPDAPVASNLLRVHWFNSSDRRHLCEVPAHLDLPPALTGVEARILVALGTAFPLIRAHKVLAAYGCLVPRLVTGQFDPTRQRAVWPSTGNYCRGGVAISRILGCHGVAVLPEGMSRERFEWLERWVKSPQDIVRTPGTESNVKEIYDASAELERDERNVILNQFREFGNYLVHRTVTGPALERLFDAVGGRDDLRARASVFASGSAGTLAAGDHLKTNLGAEVCVVEALECPTLLYNGFGEHNIQGIGDKHVPFIHNVYNTDYVAGVSDASTDALNVLFNIESGREYLRRRKHVDPALVDRLAQVGLSGIANVVASIKLAKYLHLGPQDAILTVATDGAELYASEAQKTVCDRFSGEFDEYAAAEVFGRHLLGIATDHLVELDRRQRDRIFNLGYYTWVEQQRVPVEDFEARRSPRFWTELAPIAPIWDELIDDFNRATGTAP